MKYEKDSFLVIPNKHTLEGIDPHIQVIYFWLCDFADPQGKCYPSRSTLALKAGVSVKTVDRSILKMIEMGLIVKENRYKENEKTSNLYQLMLVKGGSVLGTLGSVPQSLPLGTNRRIELNPVLTQPTYTGEAPLREVFEEDEKPPKPKKDTAYLGVFSLWGDYPPNWRKNTTEIAAAKSMLEETDLETLKWGLEVYNKFKADPYCPQILKPSDLDRKWDNLMAFKKKHG